MPAGSAVTTRIEDAFSACRRDHRKAFIAYITAGDPTPDLTVDLILALERGGTTILELGVPFSDPIADGPVIQRASDRSLRAGTTLGRILDMVREVRRRSNLPIILFSYLNPLLRYGFERLATEAAEAGVDGVLLTDLSIEEAGDTVTQLRRHGLDTIFLAAPTSTERRMRLVAEQSSGFVYLVSRTGITGEQQSLSSSIEPLVRRMREATKLPLAVGFGVSTPEQVANVAAFADGVIVGSALVRLIETHAGDADLPAKLEAFTRQLTAPLASR